MKWEYLLRQIMLKLELDGIVYKATAADAAGILNDKNVQETSIIVEKTPQ